LPKRGNPPFGKGRLGEILKINVIIIIVRLVIITEFKGRRQR
jgi:hypothetical protein